jgi:hypothetical protein
MDFNFDFLDEFGESEFEKTKKSVKVRNITTSNHDAQSDEEINKMATSEDLS